jgi:hypothetical protein
MSETIKALLKITLILFITVGYVMCVIKLINCDFQAPFKAEFLYTIGSFTGLGGILGWFNFGK